MCRQTLFFKLKHLDILFDIENSYLTEKNVEKSIPPVKISHDLTDHEVFSLLHAKSRSDVVCNYTV